MSVFNLMLQDRPFVLFVIALILGFCSLVFGNIWLLVAAVAFGAYAHYTEKKEVKNGQDLPD